MAEAVLLALSKTEACLADETTRAVILKLSIKCTNLKELPEKITQIRDYLQTLNNVIREIETSSFNDAVVKGWTAEVRKIAFHVEDVMDKYSYHSRELQDEGFLKKFFIKGTRYPTVFSEISDDIARMLDQIEQVIKLKEHWLRPSQLISANFKTDSIDRQRAKCSFPDVTAGDLVGIEENRIMLSEWLHSDELESTVITVSGMGGLGKTTLVMNVYEREKINFPVHVWIHVSQNYSVDSMLRKLLSSIGYLKQAQSDKIDKMDVYDLKEEIKAMLRKRKCLIVLDDVWDQGVYFQIRDALQNLQASRIIITTRLNHVAALAPTNRRLELQPLNNVDAFDLFCRRAFYEKDHRCPQELENVSTSIVDRCHGLPLAIVSIGGMLSSMTPTAHVWNQAYNQLRSELADNDHVMAILNLSYNVLPGNLRNCFLYCSLFPEDYPMPRESLVRLWVAEGFVVRKEHNSPEEVAESYLMELIQRNMLQPVEYDEIGRVSTCTMHDIVRDLAFYVSREEKFGSAYDYRTMVQVERDVRRLSICRWRNESGPRARFPRLRTLVALEIPASSLGMLSSVFSESVWLTVLELQDSTITEVPSSIGYLFNLRYIGLRRTYVKSLPDSIEKLYNLHTLDIKETKIEKIPRGICHVKKLRHLLADRFVDEEQLDFRFFVGVEAPKGLQNLEGLQTLETVQSSKDLAEQLEKLMQLRSVWIDNISSAHCAELFSTLSKMPLLSSLLLSATDENEALHFETLRPTSTNLHRLIVRGRWADGALECPIFRDHGRHLKYLALDWCQLGEDPLGVLTPHVSNLTYLSLDKVRSANTLVLSAGCFPHLRTLILKRMPDVEQLDIMVGALPCIENFYIVELENLKRISREIESLLSLKKLWLVDLHRDFKAIVHKMQHVPELRV